MSCHDPLSVSFTILARVLMYSCYQPMISLSLWPYVSVFFRKITRFYRSWRKSGWPSGLRRCVQVAVYFCRRGFESHFWHLLFGSAAEKERPPGTDAHFWTVLCPRDLVAPFPFFHWNLSHYLSLSFHTGVVISVSMGVNSNLLFLSSPQTQQFLGPLILQVQPQVDSTGENRMKKKSL